MKGLYLDVSILFQLPIWYTQVQAPHFSNIWILGYQGYFDIMDTWIVGYHGQLDIMDSQISWIHAFGYLKNQQDVPKCVNIFLISQKNDSLSISIQISMDTWIYG